MVFQSRFFKYLILHNIGTSNSNAFLLEVESRMTKTLLNLIAMNRELLFRSNINNNCSRALNGFEKNLKKHIF